MSQYIAESERLLMRAMTEEDCEMVRSWRNQDRIREHYIYRELISKEEQQRYYHERVLSGQVFHYVVCTKDPKETPIACVIYHDYHPERSEIEGGLFIGEDSALGKGYGPEMFRMGAQYIMRHLGITRVVTRIEVGNDASIVTNLRAGFLKTGILREVHCSDGSTMDMAQLLARPDTVNRPRTER